MVIYSKDIAKFKTIITVIVFIIINYYFEEDKTGKDFHHATFEKRNLFLFFNVNSILMGRGGLPGRGQGDSVPYTFSVSLFT